MPRKELRGSRLMVDEHTLYDPDDPEDLQALIAENSVDELWDCFSETCKEILSRVDGPLTMDVNCFEWSAEYIAGEYLQAYEAYKSSERSLYEKGPSAASLSLLKRDFWEMAVLFERFYWRCGIDPETGKVREKLGDGKKRQELSREKATAARVEKAKANEPDWWEDARQRAAQIRRQHPEYNISGVASLIAEEEERGERQVMKVIRHLWK